MQAVASDCVRFPIPSHYPHIFTTASCHAPDPGCTFEKFSVCSYIIAGHRVLVLPRRLQAALGHRLGQLVLGERPSVGDRRLVLKFVVVTVQVAVGHGFLCFQAMHLSVVVGRSRSPLFCRVLSRQSHCADDRVSDASSYGIRSRDGDTIPFEISSSPSAFSSTVSRPEKTEFCVLSSPSRFPFRPLNPLHPLPLLLGPRLGNLLPMGL